MTDRISQVSGFVFRESPLEESAPEYLALRRSPDRGGFWQGVTGGVEHTDESIEHAIRREVLEELGLTALSVIDPDYHFSFDDEHDGNLREDVFGVQVDSSAEPVLSDEHDAAFWVPYPDMRALITAKWADNGEGLDVVDSVVQQYLPKTPELSFGTNSWALLIVKPDAKELGVEDEINDGLANRGVVPVLSKYDQQLDRSVIDQIWLPPRELDPWYFCTVDYMQRRPVDIHLVNGPHATQTVQELKRDLRVKYDKNYRDDESAPAHKRVESIIHGSDRTEELARQALLFFQEDLNDAIARKYPTRK